MKKAQILFLATLLASACGSSAGTAQGSPAAGSSPSERTSPSAAVAPWTGCGGGDGSTPAAGHSLQASPASTVSPSGTSGAITGSAGFPPPNGAAPQLVYAISTTGASAYSAEIVAGQYTFSIKGVAPGAYHVFAAVRPLVCKGSGTVLGAAYSDFWKCGGDPACAHTPVEVIVQAGATTDRVNPGDWFTSDNTVPAPPVEIVRGGQTQPTLKAYASARDAAVAAASAHASAIVVENMAVCPINRACVTIGLQHDGTQAAYFYGEGGSNADVLACLTYVVHDPAGWRGVRSQCPAGFPVVGQSGMVWLGGVTAGRCGANVRSAPGPTGTVVGCLQHHTGVSIDGGPVYAQMSSVDGIWWHLAGRGWMADDFLIFPEICGCD